jgi:hypothetical protein
VILIIIILVKTRCSDDDDEYGTPGDKDKEHFYSEDRIAEDRT